jgi:peptide/nickel transport system ATP-binding protein
MNGAPLLALEHATKTFELKSLFGPIKRVEALRDVSLTLGEGRALAVVGESGSGKSTLGRAVTGLFSLTAGRVLYRGTDIAGIRHRDERRTFRRSVQMVFQDPFSALNPAHTVRHHLERPLRLHYRLSGEALAAEVDRVTRDVELDPAVTLGKYPHELSGGQRQRVNLARALAVGAELMVADEPTSMLDVSIRRAVLDLIARLKAQRGLTLLYITHDIATAHYLAEDTAVMFAGRIVEMGPSREVIANPRHPYTRILLSAIPDAKVRLGGSNAKAAADFSAEIARLRALGAADEASPLTEVATGHFVRATS